MKYGVNTFVWSSPCTTSAVKELSPKVKAMGFDILEISVEDPSLFDWAVVRDVLKANQLEGIICGAFGPDRNICSTAPNTRENAKKYIRQLIDAAQVIGSPVITGPMYSSVGKDHLETAQARTEEWKMAVLGIREMADYAAAKGIKLAFEPLNRFETDMINVVAQGNKFIQDVGRDNVGFHLDTFHMHLEEKDSAEAIRSAGNKIFHFHACENDRGVPGTGQVRWQEIAKALKETGYTGPVVIESFTDQVKEIAKAVCIWREIAPNQDAIAADGLKFLRSIMA
ncbi:MAG: sugar phosphate isomerase/epimerase [Chloroflexota bacterium]